MRLKPLLLSVIGLVIAGGSVFVAQQLMPAPVAPQSSSETQAMADVVVARSAIPFGQAIESHLVSVQSWPRENIPPGSFSSIEDVTAQAGEKPRRAKGPIFKGEVLLISKLSDPGDKVTIVHKLAEDTRAMAIKVDAVTAVGGFVTPGDSVDIVLTEGRGRDMRTITILQDIRVIGVDQRSEEPSDTPEVARTITVEVTREQGQRLALAQTAGKLSLTLRTLDAGVDQDIEVTRISDLLDPGPVETRIAAPRTIIIRRAGVAQVVEIR